jgi:hypothetical protein
MIDKCVLCGEIKELIDLVEVCSECESELIEEMEQMRKEDYEEAYFTRF